MNSLDNKVVSVLLLLVAAVMHLRAEDPADFRQMRRVTGRVIDAETGRPVADVTIGVPVLQFSVSTDAKGRFVIDVPAAAAVEVTITKNGYRQSDVSIGPDRENKVITLYRDTSPVSELRKLSVTAQRHRLKNSEHISKVTISNELITDLPAMGQPDVFRTLQLLPGISGTNESSSALFVRGGTPDQNLIYLDGMPIYYVDHFYGFYSAFNPWAIDEVSIHKGGFGPQWGGRLSSVVDMSSSGSSRTYPTEGIGGKAALGAGSLSSRGFLQLPIINSDIGTFMIAGRRSMTDLYRTRLFDDLFNRLHGTDTTDTEPNTSLWNPTFNAIHSIVYEPEFTFWDVNGLATLRLGTGGTLSSTFFMSRDYQDNSLDTSSFALQVNVSRVGPPPEQGPPDLRFDTITTVKQIDDKAVSSWGNLCIGEQWEQKWSDVFTSSVNVSYSGFIEKEDNVYLRSVTISHHLSDTISPIDSVVGSPSSLKSTNELVDLSGRVDNTFRLADWNTLTAGVAASQKSVLYEQDSVPPGSGGSEGDLPSSVTRQETPPVFSHDSGLSVAGYIGDAMTFGNRAGVMVGGRFYYFTQLSSGAVDPRISGWWKPVPALKVKAAWGMYTQEIHRAEKEDITSGRSYIWLLSTKTRPLEKSQQFIGGLSWEKTHILFDVEAYYKRLSGLLTVSERPPPAWKPQEQFNPDALLLYEGTGVARGIEFLVHLRDAPLPLLSGKLTCSGWLSYTFSSVRHTYSVFNNGNPFPATQDRPHEVKLVHQLTWNMASWSRLSTGAVWLYSTGTPYTAPLGEYSVVMMDSLMPLNLSYVSQKNAYRLPDYHRLDLSVDWNVFIGKHIEARATLGFFNVYNHENILERTYTGKQVDRSGLNPEPVGNYDMIEKRSIMFQFNPALTLKARF